MDIRLGTRYADELPELALPWQAKPVPAPELLLLNEPLAVDLGLDVAWLRSPAGLQLLVGGSVPDGARPVAQAYAGHQFGGYTPRLGDGRALLLGELPDGRDLHLKGSGATPFSRGGDGLAAVGPMLREYVVSEALHALGIPSTRALAVVATGGVVQRETDLPGAVLVRVASSHLRVGTFAFARETGDLGLLGRLVDHALDRHQVADRSALGLLASVIGKQASLIAQWMAVGFVHGVMNTDNTTISGETIDYGPCAFMEAYDPATVFSSIDHGGRYAYGNQPVVGEWNLARLAEALLPLIDDDEDRAVELATEVLRGYRPAYASAWLVQARAKLGLAADTEDAVVGELVDDLLRQLHASRVDWTSFWRALSAGTARDMLLDLATYDAWVERWSALAPDRTTMDQVNPVYVPRNRVLEQALSAATAGDLGPVRRVLAAVTRPFEERDGFDDLARPDVDGLDGFQTFCGT